MLLLLLAPVLLLLVAQVLTLELPVVAYQEYTNEMLRSIDTPVVKPLGYTHAPP